MSLSLETKRAARNQLIDPGADETHPSDVVTPAEVAFITATQDLPTHEGVDSTEAVLLCTDNEQQIEIQATIPADGTISENSRKTDI